MAKPTSKEKKALREFEKRISRGKTGGDRLGKEYEAFNQELRAKAKEPAQLLIPILCEVLYVTGVTHSTSFTPLSEVRFGGVSPNYEGGQVSRLEINVQTKAGIDKVIFIGLPPIHKGCLIRAYILKGEAVEEKSLGLGDFERPKHLIGRDFRKVEQAVKIDLLRNASGELEALATYTDEDLLRHYKLE